MCNLLRNNTIVGKVKGEGLRQDGHGLVIIEMCDRYMVVHYIIRYIFLYV